MSSTTFMTNTKSIPVSLPDDFLQQMMEKYKNASPQPINVKSDTQALITFNGYYTLNSANGAFFAIDTNVIVLEGLPIYDITLFISLDGTTSYQYGFTGTFENNQLKQSASAGGADINLTFTRANDGNGYTATCAGTISVQGGAVNNVTGYTYNNPIPAALYKGSYYEMVNGSPVLAMQIGDNNQLLYDNGSNSGTLQPVPFYCYNMNMYYFSFLQGSNVVRLIMGTAAASGFACNNMIVNGGVKPPTVTVRSLTTIPGSKAGLAPSKVYYNNISALAGFSGYYPLPSIAPLAFLSVQASYQTNGSTESYQVAISVSMDGVSSTGWYFDPSTMSFDNNTLSMTDQGINVTFNREYNAIMGSLVTVTGSVKGHSVTGYNLLNPVPLSAFGGVPMTDANGDKLTIVSDSEVTYNGTAMTGIIYVPLMYILAWPAAAPTVEMSFGTNMLNGNTCIITDGRVTPATTAVVSAIQTAS